MTDTPCSAGAPRSASRRATVPLVRILDVAVEKPLMGELLDFDHLISFESARQVPGLRGIRFMSRGDQPFEPQVPLLVHEWPPPHPEPHPAPAPEPVADS